MPSQQKAHKRRIPRPRMHSSGQWRVTFSTPTGPRTYYLGKPDSAAANARYAELLEEWEQGKLAREEPKTVADLDEEKRAARMAKACRRTLREALDVYEDFLDSSGRHAKKEGTRTSERDTIRSTLKDFCNNHGEVIVGDFDGATLLSWRDELEARQALTRQGINRKLSCLKRALRWLKQRTIPGTKCRWISRDAWADVVEVEPIRRGELPTDREVVTEKDAVPFEDIEKTAAECGTVVGAMLMLMALSGARPGEVCRLRHGDIDRSDRPDGCWVWNVRDGKTANRGKRIRYVLPPPAVTLLKQVSGMPEALVFTPTLARDIRDRGRRAARQSKETKQTRDRDSRPKRPLRPYFLTDSFRQAVQRAAKRAKVETFGLHEVRHSYATRAAQQFGVMAAQAALCHSSPNTTARYLHPDDDDAFRVAIGLSQAATG